MYVNRKILFQSLSRHSMVQITNVVVQTDLYASINLRHLTNSVRSIRYDPGVFSGAIWHHRKIGGCCLVFHNGKLNCNGNRSIEEAKKRIRRYARLIQGLGYCVKLKTIELVTMTAVHELSSPLDFDTTCTLLSGATYEPETHNAVMLKRGRVHYNCFQSGKVVITGLRNVHTIYATLLELELCTT